MTWDANATASHSDSEAVVFEDFDVSEFVDLLLTGEDNILAFQGMNTSDRGSDFLIAPKLSGEFNDGE